MQAITFMGSPVCPYCQRIELALLDAALPHTVERVELGRLSSEQRQRFPTGRVPILEVAGETLFESGAIVEWISERRNDAYLPADSNMRARVRGLCLAIDALHDTLRRFFTATTEAVASRAHEQLVRQLSALERLGGPWAKPAPSGGDRRGLYLSAFYLAPLALLCRVLQSDGYPLLAAAPGLARTVAELEDEHASLQLLRTRERALCEFLLGVQSVVVADLSPSLTRRTDIDQTAAVSGEIAGYFAAKV